MASGERTEAATPRRLKELREKGNVARSVDLSTAAALLTGFAVLQWAGDQGATQIGRLLERSISSLSQGDLTTTQVYNLAAEATLIILTCLAPLLVALPTIGLISGLVQTGPLLSLRVLSPNFDRLNPLSGVKRIVSLRTLVELVKTLAKVGVIGFVVFRMYADLSPQFLSLASTDSNAATFRLVQVAIHFGLVAGLTLFVLAILDFGYQHWENQRSSRMTKDELREEMRQTEGRPETRARVRRAQRKLGSKRMMQEVPRADVIVTNPTHYAVALSYDRAGIIAPRVVAKGAGVIAQRIKETARRHGIPIVENPPLAQGLYWSVAIGDQIPVNLFQAVAELLAHVYKLRDRAKAGVTGG